MIDEEFVRKAIMEQGPKTMLSAYKKLKSSVYFDKTRIHLAERIVEFEKEVREDDGPAAFADASFMLRLSNKLEPILNTLRFGSDRDWNDLAEKICRSIDVLVFPKETVSNYEIADSSHKADDATSGSMIRITRPETSRAIVRKTQSFIDMDVKGFLLGILWVIVVGTQIDRDFGSYVYGNRIRQAIRKNPGASLTMSPYLFEPYFKQYESWRDDALDAAESAASKITGDVFLLMTDIKTFYYSVDFDDGAWRKLATDLGVGTDDQPDKPTIDAGCMKIITRLNGFVKNVIDTYSKRFRKLAEKVEPTNVLPIGFEPSSILANWCLSPFDEEVMNKINPLYYGRYVDDIIIVDRAVEQSSFGGRLREDDFTVDEMIRTYFGIGRNGPRFCKFKSENESCLNGDLLVSLALNDDASSTSDDSAVADSDPKEKRGAYRINPEYLGCQKSDIILQSNKTNMITLAPGSQNLLLDHFRETIAKNSSEFRLMPSLEDMDLDSVFSDIFEIDSAASPNKLRDLRELKLNPFELSKYLGRCQRVLPLICKEDAKDLCSQIKGIYSYRDYVSLPTTWEKLLEIMCLSGELDLGADLICDIAKAIDGLDVQLHEDDKLFASDNATISESVKRALRTNLSGVARKMSSLLSESELACITALLEEAAEKQQRSARGDDDLSELAQSLKDSRNLYRLANMADRYAMPIPPALVNCFNQAPANPPQVHPFIQPELLSPAKLTDVLKKVSVSKLVASAEKKEKVGEAETDSLICSLETTLSPLPYMIKMQEVQFALQGFVIARGLALANDQRGQATKEIYGRLNYFTDLESSIAASDEREGHCERISISPPMTGSSVNQNEKPRYFATLVKSETREPKTRFRIAVANIGMKDDVLDAAIKEREPSYSDYAALERLTREAKREHVDIIVLPELSVPFEWIPRLYVFCANEDIALVCGVRYVLGGKARCDAHNYTATILPFTMTNENGSYKYADLRLHDKVFFPPKEAKRLAGHQKKPVLGDTFDLFVWKDLWFPVYCCFELASPAERTAFSGLADAVLAVEWNKDIPFYSSLIATLSRDMSCYCVQANNSVYGDSCIERPTKSVSKSIVRVSGGSNWSLMIGELDLEAIRDCQIRSDGFDDFKPTAPDFLHDLARLRMDGSLWDWLKQNRRL